MAVNCLIYGDFINELISSISGFIDDSNKNTSACKCRRRREENNLEKEEEEEDFVILFIHLFIYTVFVVSSR